MLSKEQKVVIDKLRELYDLLPVLSTLERGILDRPGDLTYLADTAYTIRESIKVLEGVEKRLKEVGHKCESVACQILSMLDDQTYKTEHCTVSPNPEFYVEFPSSPRDEGFESFVKQLPPEALRPHYPTVCELVTKAIQDGGQLPYGLKHLKGVIFKLRITPKRGTEI